jgi:hypothetical protein
MKLVAENSEAALAAVRALSERAVNTPLRKNVFAKYAPVFRAPVAPREPVTHALEKSRCQAEMKTMRAVDGRVSFAEFMATVPQEKFTIRELEAHGIATNYGGNIKGSVGCWRAAGRLKVVGTELAASGHRINIYSRTEANQ